MYSPTHTHAQPPPALRHICLYAQLSSHVHLPALARSLPPRTPPVRTALRAHSACTRTHLPVLTALLAHTHPGCTRGAPRTPLYSHTALLTPISLFSQPFARTRRLHPHTDTACTCGQPSRCLPSHTPSSSRAVPTLGRNNRPPQGHNPPRTHPWPAHATRDAPSHLYLQLYAACSLRTPLQPYTRTRESRALRAPPAHTLPPLVHSLSRIPMVARGWLACPLRACVTRCHAGAFSPLRWCQPER